MLSTCAVTMPPQVWAAWAIVVIEVRRRKVLCAQVALRVGVRGLDQGHGDRQPRLVEPLLAEQVNHPDEFLLGALIHPAALTAKVDEGSQADLPRRLRFRCLRGRSPPQRLSLVAVRSRARFSAKFGTTPAVSASRTSRTTASLYGVRTPTCAARSQTTPLM